MGLSDTVRTWQARLAGPGHAPRAEDRRAIAANSHYLKALQQPASTVRERRHERIEDTVIREIACSLRRLALSDCRMLQLQAGRGQQTLLFRDQLIRAWRPAIYDVQDARDQEAAEQTDFAAVDFEAARFPAPDGHFGLVIWNRELVTVKNAVPVLREVRRVLTPDGIMIVSVPNLAALHNRFLLLAGFQPSTLHISQGDHVRGFASSPMTRALERDLGFQVQQVTGVGLAPVSSAVQPWLLRSVSHTVVWVLRSPGGVAPGRPSGDISNDRGQHPYLGESDSGPA